MAGPACGSSDHNTVHLFPVYKTVLKREKVRKRQVQLWNEEPSLALQGCFDCTDWSVFTDSSDNIDELTDVVCSYTPFCRDNVIPIKVVKVFPNNKPWASSALKGLILKRKKAFMEGNVTEVKEIKKEIRSEIKRAKLAYKDKIEAELGSNNLKEAWQGIKLMTGCTDKGGNRKIALTGFNSESSWLMS